MVDLKTNLSNLWCRYCVLCCGALLWLVLRAAIILVETRRLSLWIGESFTFTAAAKLALLSLVSDARLSHFH